MQLAFLRISGLKSIRAPNTMAGVNFPRLSAPVSRRRFLAGSAALVGSVATRAAAPAEPVIDIHQHTNYHGRTNEQMLAHQRAMGVTQTILLPAGRPLKMPSTHDGRSIGLGAGTGGNDSVLAFARAHPGEFLFGANEITDLPEARAEIEKYLKLGAVIIGEQKFGVQCDSAASQELYRLAQDYNVPVLLHFQEGTYNSGFERLPAMLEKFPKVNFIGHAQTLWAHIDKAYDRKQGLYPLGPVTPGGLTDRYLADFPNFYADMSAGSGLNALIRDEEHARWFLAKHQRKILYGSDCTDTLGRGPGCQGAGTLAAIRRFAPDKTAERRILYENSKQLFRL
jgi:predicted TIM-barrel fold metal-dependent hydrolase